MANKRQTEIVTTEPPIIDQHLSILTHTPEIWILPLGVFAIGLRFREAIVEYVDLVSGLVLSIFQSVLGKFIIQVFVQLKCAADFLQVWPIWQNDVFDNPF